MPDGERKRAVARCRSCNSAYAVNIWSDGTVQPIGGRSDCDCGDADFEILGDVADTVLEDESVE
ncbi:hypothetical protein CHINAEXTREME_11900 [Halobiforma lacisalsi AJ5]|uniref:Uncharacterized protein n=1 Tax=Natronobacterium lacisalsi AJ5 TaxID=358396 RepID=A0A1P8LRP0_NATLA|nr:hypothetical protein CHINAEXTREME_11900 [Halobiforma lacisalsi AJ5]